MTPARKARRYCVALALLLLLGAGCGPREAPVQAKQRPLGLPVIGPVEAAGSDLSSWWFRWWTLPSLIKLAATEYTQKAIADHFNKLVLDPAKLALSERCNVRVYFVGEAAGYINALGVNAAGCGIAEGKPFTIFPNATTKVHLYESGATLWNQLFLSRLRGRSSDAPLIPGDFVDLGKYGKGTVLNFFLSANQGENVYTAVPEKNPDGIEHMVAIAIKNSPYLLMSYEDMYGGGDRGFEDCVFAVEMGENNIAGLVGQIDPLRRAKQLIVLSVVLAFLIGGPMAIRFQVRRVQRKRLNEQYAQVEQLLASGRPRAASDLLQACRQDVFDRETLDDWARLAMAAFENAGDVENLCKLYERLPHKFVDSEAPALIVAKAEVEAERFDYYTALREEWRGREESLAGWMCLDSDVLVKRDEEENALVLIEKASFEGPRDAGRLARLALLKAKDSPDEAVALANHAAVLNPRDPDVHVALGVLLETQSRLRDALAEYQAAVACAPSNFFLRDRLADFYRRSGDCASALTIWTSMLNPPSMDFIWLRVLFWSRVACKVAVPWEQLIRPSGALDSLVQFVLDLPPGRFWDSKEFGPIADYEPELLSRQDVFWWRVLEALRTGAEEEALTLLSLHGFGARSWHADLELALVRIILFRRTQFFGSLLTVPETGLDRGTRHPLFLQLDDWAQHKTISPPDAAAQFLEGPYAFAGAFYAAGWREAAMALAGARGLPPDALSWLNAR